MQAHRHAHTSAELHTLPSARNRLPVVMFELLCPLLKLGRKMGVVHELHGVKSDDVHGHDRYMIAVACLLERNGRGDTCNGGDDVYGSGGHAGRWEG